MGSINGVELARRIRKENAAVQIVFITGFPDFISDGYDVSALHYLMKPVLKEKLFEVLHKATVNLAKTEESVIFPVNGEARRVLQKDIIYAEAFAHTCVICTKTRSFEVRMGISEIEKALTESFVRCHRSYIVGIRNISSISKTDITLDDGKKIPLSRGNYQAVNQAFIRYFKGD
jgi:DNA-binding LytR/AlgR family response regulator